MHKRHVGIIGGVIVGLFVLMLIFGDGPSSSLDDASANIEQSQKSLERTGEHIDNIGKSLERIRSGGN